MELDFSLYPDREPPIEWNDAERAEYVERLCRQFDFGTPIASKHVIALRAWKDIFDRFPLLDSPAYHAIRAYFGWPRLQPRYRSTGWKPAWELQDEREGRAPDRSMWQAPAERRGMPAARPARGEVQQPAGPAQKVRDNRDGR